MSVLKKLASETAIYGLSSILGRMVYYFLVMLHTAIFSAGELAVTISLFSWVAILNIIYGMGMETTYMRYASQAKNKIDVYNKSLTIVLVVNLAATILIIAFKNHITHFIDFTPTQASFIPTFIVWMALVTLLDGIVAIPFAKLRLENQSKRFAKTRFINILLNVAFNLFFFLVLRTLANSTSSLGFVAQKLYNPVSAVGLIFMANLLANIVTAFMLKDQLLSFKPSFDTKTAKEYWFYASPLLIMSLAGAANQLFDRLTLTWFLPTNFYPGLKPEEALGIYGNCIKLAIFMNLAVQAFRYAADPFFFAKAKDKNAPSTQALVMKYFIITCTVLWLAIGLNLDLLTRLFLRNPIYLQGANLVLIMLAANMLLGIYYNLSMWFKLTDNTQYGLYFTLGGFALNFALSYILIPEIGYYGSAWAFLGSMALISVLCYWVGKTKYPVPYDLRSALVYMGVAGGILFLSTKIIFENRLVDFLFNNAILCILLLIIYLYEIKIKKSYRLSDT